MNYCYCRILIGIATNQRVLARDHLSLQAKADAETGLRNLRQLLVAMTGRAPVMALEERNDAGLAYAENGPAEEFRKHELEHACA